MSKLSFFIILFIGFVDYLGIGLVYPVFASLLFDPNDPIIPADASMAFRGGMLGVLIALTPLSQFFCSPILGAFSDIKGRRSALTIGIAIGCVGYVLAVLGIWMHSLTLLFLYRLLVGVSDSTAAVAQATLADISTEENKARRFSLLNASLGIGFTIGPFLGGKLADPNCAALCGYATPFIVAGLMCLTNLILVLWKFPETKPPLAHATFNLMQGVQNVAKVFQMRPLWWLFAAGFAFSFSWSFFNEFIPVFLIERFAFTPSRIGNFYAVSGGWYAISTGFATAPLLKLIPAEKLIVKASLGCTLCMLTFLLINNPQGIWWALPPLMYCLAIINPTSVTIVSNRTSSEKQGEVLGVFQSVQACSMAISPLFFGSAIGAYPSLTAWGGAFSMALAALAFWMSCHRISPSTELK